MKIIIFIKIGLLISTGAYNENQDLSFTVVFSNPDLIDNFNLDSEGYFNINPFKCKWSINYLLYILLMNYQENQNLLHIN